jgi:hypothetical protein
LYAGKYGNKNNIPLPLMKGEPVKISKLKVNLAKVKPEVTPVTQKTPEPQKTEEAQAHESMKFILFAVTGGLVGLALYFSK